ncbi:MAG: carbamoyltransferase HypF [Candidatus Gastranaerophilales bacterium]|nr:carbamoyltransferase HypF [Candidatus Gastranaerophilales bacterium]
MRVRKKIIISGIISCKSFISYVFSKAKKCKLSGWINAGNDSTSIEIEGDNASIFEFLSNIYDDPNRISRVANLDLADIPVINSENFYVIDEKTNHNPVESVPRDIATCDNCLDNLYDEHSEHYQYPFVACKECGPKYSTIYSLPYTRENSSIGEFKFCDKCTNSIDKGIFDVYFSNCSECGPKAWLIEKNKTYYKQECFNRSAKILENNKVLLFKSTNCFYLCANALSVKAIDKIRDIKNRKDKPLTVMVNNIEEAEKFTFISDTEKELLKSSEKPIVMLKIKDPNYLAHNVANNFNKIGVMLPSNPLQHLLFSSGRLKVLVMSSANKSGRAIEIDNNNAEETYKDIVDGILLHDLNICNGSDDSIVAILKDEKYFLRLARGYAPNYISLNSIQPYPAVLACGAYQNSTIAIATSDGKVHISPYTGDLNTANVFYLYKRNIILFCKLLNVTPEYAVCDMNPDYLSTRYVQNLRIPYFQVQHHYAHLLSCLADNKLPVHTPVIGVIFDGSGFGDDQTVWGGEFLVSRDLKYERVANIPVFKMIGIKDKEFQVHRLGYSLLHKSGIDPKHPVYKNLKISSEKEKMFSNLINTGVGSPLTSSAGKLFDAVASILGIIKYSSYDEYSVLYLESLANINNWDVYKLSRFNINKMNELIQFIVKDIENNIAIPDILAKFHNTLAKMIAFTCYDINFKTKISTVALSGSVWMNLLLLTRTIEELEKLNLNVLTHKNISTNDEGLSLGQAVYAAYKLSVQKDQTSNNICINSINS